MPHRRPTIRPVVAAAALLVLLQAGCGPVEELSSGRPHAPVRIDMVRGVRWDYPHEGYDQSLPGYHLAGGIGTITLAAGAPPDEFVLEIRTTMAHRPNLEGFAVEWADTVLQITPFAEGARAEITVRTEGTTGPGKHTTTEQTYFGFVRTDEIVRVRFLPPALRLIPLGCTVSWVDWYRR